MTPRTVVWVAVLSLGITGTLQGQEDFRAADADRPIRVEDAYPVKLYEWEWELGTRGSIARGGEYLVSQILELKMGIARNWQLGVELHGNQERVASVWQTGLEELSGSLFYNLNQEGRRTPALAVRADVFSPGAGDLGREDVGARLRTILTRSYSRLRVHVNAAYDWASAADGGDFWSGGLAFDYPIGLFSKAVLGDVYAEIPADGGDARVWVEFGTRFQVNNSRVLDLGVMSRVDQWNDGIANFGVVIGLSGVFGIPGLIKVPPYPNPRIN